MDIIGFRDLCKRYMVQKANEIVEETERITTEDIYHSISTVKGNRYKTVLGLNDCDDCVLEFKLNLGDAYIYIDLFERDVKKGERVLKSGKIKMDYNYFSEIAI